MRAARKHRAEKRVTSSYVVACKPKVKVNDEARNSQASASSEQTVPELVKKIRTALEIEEASAPKVATMACEALQIEPKGGLLAQLKECSRVLFG